MLTNYPEPGGDVDGCHRGTTEEIDGERAVPAAMTCREQWLHRTAEPETRRSAQSRILVRGRRSQDEGPDWYTCLVVPTAHHHPFWHYLLTLALWDGLPLSP